MMKPVGRRPDESLAAASPARIAGMFDAIAPRYDFLNRLLSAGVDRSWRRRAIASLDLTGRERLLDICAGTADQLVAALTSPKPAARAIGVDFSQAMLRLGQAKLRRARLTGRAALVAGDALAIPLPDRSVDAVTVAFGVRNVANLAAACAEMRRVLRAGGRLAVLEFAIPRSPLVGPAYRWYFRRVLPLVGRAVSGHASAYSYLPESVRSFPEPEAFARLLIRTGFVDVTSVPLTFGIVYLYSGVRG